MAKKPSGVKPSAAGRTVSPITIVLQSDDDAHGATRPNLQIWVWALGLTLGLLASPVFAASWVQTTTLPDTYSGHSLVYASNNLYQAGGASGINGVQDGTNVFRAQVHNDGTIGIWTNVTSLPESVIFHAGVAANGYVYVLGGNDYDPDNGLIISSNVFYAKINADASLGAWQTAIALPTPLTFLSAATWNNRIYVVGGTPDGSSLSSNVYSATIQSNGSLSAWTTQASLPVAIYTQAEAANGYLYVLGGAIGDGSEIENLVYYTKINSDGSLAGWNQTIPLPQSESSFNVVAANGYVFSIGGYNGSGMTSSFYVGLVNGNGSINPWSSGASLPLSLAEQATAANASYILVVS